MCGWNSGWYERGVLFSGRRSVTRMARNGELSGDYLIKDVRSYIIILTLGVDKTVCPKTEGKKCKNPRDELLLEVCLRSGKRLHIRCTFA